MSREYIPTHLKRLVIERAHGCCEYCTSPSGYSPSPFAIEHVIPVSKKGPTIASNLALACQGCNGPKYNKTTGIDPISNQSVPLFHPRRDAWHDHWG
ncbi:MAG: HNH endonuclease [Chloroflexota bacterium]